MWGTKLNTEVMLELCCDGIISQANNIILSTSATCELFHWKETQALKCELQ